MTIRGEGLLFFPTAVHLVSLCLGILGLIEFVGIKADLSMSCVVRGGSILGLVSEDF